MLANTCRSQRDTFLKILALFLALSGVGFCQCACTTTVSVTTSAFLSFGRTYSVPRMGKVARSSITDLPTVARITIDKKGEVCALQFTSAPLKDILIPLEQSIRKWTFRPPSMVSTGEAVCMRSKVYVYERISGGSVVWDIPELTDRRRPK